MPLARLLRTVFVLKVIHDLCPWPYLTTMAENTISPRPDSRAHTRLLQTPPLTVGSGSFRLMEPPPHFQPTPHSRLQLPQARPLARGRPRDRARPRSGRTNPVRVRKSLPGRCKRARVSTLQIYIAQGSFCVCGHCVGKAGCFRSLSFATQTRWYRQLVESGGDSFLGSDEAWLFLGSRRSQQNQPKRRRRCTFSLGGAAQAKLRFWGTKRTLSIPAASPCGTNWQK